MSLLRKSGMIFLFFAAFLCLLIGCSGGKGDLAFNAGTYQAEGQGHNGPVLVEVKFSGSKIENVRVTEHNESDGIADKALETIPMEIVKEQSLSVDTVSGATYVSRAIIDGVADAVKQAGEDPTKLIREVAGKTEKGEVKNIETQVVIAGAGGAGLAAATASIQAGYETILLEKQSYAGGGFNYVEGVFGLDSPIQKAAGVDLDLEEMFKESMDFHHWLANSALVKAFYENAGDSIKWLMDRGVKFRGVITANPPNGNVAWHLFDGGQAGRLAVQSLKKIIEESPKGQLLFETPARELIIENGKVAGIKAVQADGTVLNIHADAVILATGGFSSNEELKEKYLRFSGYQNIGAGGREGDGIRMLEQVDAQFTGMSAVLEAGLVMPIPISQQMGPETRYPGILGTIYNEGLLTVSQQGDRYMNERLPIEFRSNATEKVGGKAYVVFDQKTVREFMTTGQRFGFGAPSVLPQLQEGLDLALSENADWIARADSLEELAEKTGMDPERLGVSVSKINQYTADGYDPDYYLEKKALFSIEEGPFYAVEVVLGMYATVGGSQVTKDLQVVNTKGEIVPGLYAIGLDAGGLYGDTYDMRIANGAASGFSITSARLAVRHIESWLK